MKIKTILFDTGVKKEGNSAFLKCLSAVDSVFTEFALKHTQWNDFHSSQLTLVLNLTLCGEKKIKTLNRQYRSKDKKTDVLSFPLIMTARKEEKKKFQLKKEIFFPTGAYELMVGDIFICKEVAKYQASEYHVTYRDELIHLFCHGFLHLLGFDHEISAKEERTMQKWEDYLVSEISKKLKRKS